MVGDRERAMQATAKGGGSADSEKMRISLCHMGFSPPSFSPSPPPLFSLFHFHSPPCGSDACVWLFVCARTRVRGRETDLGAANKHLGFRYQPGPFIQELNAVPCHTRIYYNE